MGPNQLPVQLGDFGDQGLEPAILLDPSLDLLQHGNRDIGGLGLSRDGAGQIPADVFGALLAVAARAAAVLGNLDEGAGQDRAARGQLLDSGIPHATDEGGMFWDLHVG
jgi:hypothetical protein